MEKETGVSTLTEEQRAGVTVVLRQLKERIKEIQPSLDFIQSAVHDRQLTTNEEIAELEEHFDRVREAAKGLPLQDHHDRAEVLLLAQINKNNKKFTVEGAGTVTDSRSKKWSLKDPQKLLNYAIKSGDFDMFTQSVRAKWCNKYFEQHNKRPPGTDFWEKVTLSFTQERERV